MDRDSFLRVRDNQIVEHWNNFDQLGILRQLGAVPAMDSGR
jgi:predicted ester cyclase